MQYFKRRQNLKWKKLKLSNFIILLKILTKIKKTGYISNILPVSKENKVNKTIETYCKNLVKYYSNELAIKPITK